MAVSNARETAYHIIKKKIIDLDLKPGEPVSDKDLAEQMGMSRTPVREAMIKLSLDNFIVVRPQSGTFVAPIDLELVEIEQFQRFVMEKEMIRMAMDRITPKSWDLYEENLHLYEYYADSSMADKEKKLLELDNSFHAISFKINGKENYYVRMLSSMRHIERLRALSLHMVKDSRVCHDHHLIANAIKKKDISTAEALLAEHMQLYVEHLPELQKAVPEYFSR